MCHRMLHSLVTVSAVPALEVECCSFVPMRVSAEQDALVREGLGPDHDLSGFDCGNDDLFEATRAVPVVRKAHQYSHDPCCADGSTTSSEQVEHRSVVKSRRLCWPNFTGTVVAKRWRPSERTPWRPVTGRRR